MRERKWKKILAITMAASLLFTLPFMARSAPKAAPPTDATATVYLKGSGSEFSAAGWNNMFYLGDAINAADPSVWRLAYTGKDINQVMSVHIAFTNGQEFNWDAGAGFSTNGGGKNPCWILEAPYDWAITYVNSGNNNDSGSFLVTAETGNGLNFNIGGFHQGTPDAADPSNPSGGNMNTGDTTTGDITTTADTNTTGDITITGDTTTTGDNTNPGNTTTTSDTTTGNTTTSDTTITGDNTNQPMGAGTSADPYIIDSPVQLAWLAGAENSYAKLDGPIDLTGVDWTPIGTADAPFTGFFDGNGYTIDGLTIITTDDNVGLFGCVSNGTVQNLFLTDVNISGGNNVGGVAGSFSGTMSDCVVDGSISGGNNAGGVAGNFNGTMTDCGVKGTITGGDNVGGLAGFVYGDVNKTVSVSKCASNVNITGKDKVGGLLGYIGTDPNGAPKQDPDPSTLETSSGDAGVMPTSANMDVIPESANMDVMPMSANMGVLPASANMGVMPMSADIGIMPTSANISTTNLTLTVSYFSFDVSNCCSSGSIDGDWDVGGIIGMNNFQGRITNCYSTANISGIQFIGGVAGYLVECAVTSCYATGSVAANKDYYYNYTWTYGGNTYDETYLYKGDYAGGIAGSVLYSGLTNCAALNPSVSANDTNVGRVAGVDWYANSSFTNNAANSGMTLNGSTVSSSDGSSLNGADISDADIAADGTLGGRFTDPAWKVYNDGSLPTLAGLPVYIENIIKIQFSIIIGHNYNTMP